MSVLDTYGIKDGKGNYHEEAIYSLVLIYNIINNEITAYLKDFGLTPGKFNILMAIKHQAGKEGIRQVKISKYLFVTPSNMTKMIDKLESEGLVKRSSLAGDRRVNITRITEKGSRLLDKAWGGYNNKMKDLFEMLPTDKKKKLSGLLKDWLEGIK